MTPDRFHECLAALDWSQRGLATRLGIHDSRVRRWASGRYPIPEPIAVWLDTLARFHETHPPPVATPQAIATDESENPAAYCVICGDPMPCVKHVAYIARHWNPYGET